MKPSGVDARPAVIRSHGGRTAPWVAVDPHWIDTGASEGTHRSGMLFEDSNFGGTTVDLKRHRQAAIDYVLAACGGSISSSGMKVMPRTILTPMVALMLAACAAQGSSTLSASDQPAINDNPHQMTSSDHWEVQPPMQGDNITIAAIMSKTQDETMQIACYGDDKSVAIMLVTRKLLTGAPKDRALAIAFDGEPPMPVAWPSHDYEKLGNSDFSIDDKDGGFQTAIDGLRHHQQQFATVISESGKETLKQTFWLTGADKAIGYVLKACGRA
jgi:hypothetical protein